MDAASSSYPSAGCRLLKFESRHTNPAIMRAILLPLLLVLSQALIAQESRPVTCRFLGFGASGQKSSVLTLSESGMDILCPLPGVDLSPGIVCFPKGDIIQFLSTVDRKPVAQAKLPAGSKSALLVFVPGAGAEKEQTSPSSWKVFVINDTPANFPAGGVFVANFYKGDIRFIIGEHKGMLRAAGSHGYEMPAKVDDFNMAPVTFELQQGEKWRVANESRLRFIPEIRYLIFAYADPVSGRPRISTYQDLIESQPVTAAR